MSSYDPFINANGGEEHQTLPLSNLTLNGVPTLQTNTGQFNVNYQQAFATGTTVSFGFNNLRQTTNSIFTNLSPALNAQYRIGFQQELLAGFGFGPNLRYLRIASNNKKISDIAFKDQVIATVTQIENIYWDLVSAYEQTQVNEKSSAFAQQTLENTQEAVEAGKHSRDGRSARRSRSLQARPGPDRRPHQSSTAGNSHQERCHEESG